MDPIELQQYIEQEQRRSGALAPLFDMLYEARDWLVDNCFKDVPSLMPPMLAVRADKGAPMRGVYLNQSPLGFGTYIEMNPLTFGTAADMCETLAHELAHWFVDQMYGIDQSDTHDAAWQGIMFVYLGIVADGKGKHEEYRPKWHDIHAHFLDIGLGDVLLT